MADIFLSYSRKDSGAMSRLRDRLRGEGFSVWVDEGELEPGTPDWRDAIEAGIEAAGCVVVILSPEAKESKWVAREIAYAEDRGLRIFPVLARGDGRSAVPLELVNIQRTDIRKDFEGAVSKLVKALEGHLGKKHPQPAQPKPAAKTPTDPAATHPQIVAQLTQKLGKLKPGEGNLLGKVSFTRSKKSAAHHYGSILLMKSLRDHTKKTEIKVDNLKRLGWRVDSASGMITSLSKTWPKNADDETIAEAILRANLAMDLKPEDSLRPVL